MFEAIHRGDADPKLLAYQYLQVLPQIAQGESNKVWIILSEVTSALANLGSIIPKPDAPPPLPKPDRDPPEQGPAQAHGTDDRGVELVRDAALALAPVVVGEHPRRAGAAAPDPHPYTRIGLMFRTQGRAQAVLGHDPERVALERLPNRHLARLARCGDRWSSRST